MCSTAARVIPSSTRPSPLSGNHSMLRAHVAEAPIRIVIVDDHPTIVWGLERLIESGAPRMVAVGKAADTAGAMLLIEQVQPDVVLLDLDLGKENALDAIPELLKKS